MSFIFKFISTNGTYTLFDGAYSFVIDTTDYSTIDCASLTDTDLLTVAQNVFTGSIVTLHLVRFYSYVQLRLFNTSFRILLKEEGSTVGSVSKLNFVGDNVTASLDLDDVEGETGIITIEAGDASEPTFFFANFTDILVDEDTGISQVDVVDEDLVTDAYILLDAYWGEGRPRTTNINLLQSNLYDEGTIINIVLENPSEGREYIVIKDANDNTLFTNAYDLDFAEGIYRIIFQKRDGFIALLSCSVEKRNEGIGFVNPYIRWDVQQNFDEGQRDYICNEIGATRVPYVRDAFQFKYSNVFKETSNAFSTAGNIFGSFDGESSGQCIVRMAYNGAKTVTINYIDPTEYTASKLPTINYLTIVNANNGTLTIDGTDDIFEGDAIFTLEPNESAVLANFMYYDSPFNYTRWIVIKKPFVATGGYELTANKATNFSTVNDTLYPTVEAVQEQLDLKLNISDYNEHYKGTYASLVALQTAHPTASPGDYALVDTVSVDAQWYIWDDSDSDWVPSAGMGSGPVTTDDLPEGSTNLYFTTGRASAAAPVQSVNGATGTVVLDTDDVSEGTNKYYSDAQVETYAVDHYLKYSAAQTLDAGEQTQAQTNLGLGTMATEDAADYTSNDDSVYQFNDQTGTTYTVVSGDFIPFGRMIVSCTNASPIAVSIDTPTSLGIALGSSVNIRQGGAGAVTITGTGGATLSSAAVTAAADRIITLIAKTSTSWIVVGV